MALPLVLAALVAGVALAVVSAKFGVAAGSARARRLDDLWSDLKRGDPQALGVVAVVIGVSAYVLLTGDRAG